MNHTKQPWNDYNTMRMYSRSRRQGGFRRMGVLPRLAQSIRAWPSWDPSMGEIRSRGLSAAAKK